MKQACYSLSHINWYNITRPYIVGGSKIILRAIRIFRQDKWLLHFVVQEIKQIIFRCKKNFVHVFLGQ